MKSKCRTVILVRHGHYDLASGKLTSHGRQQARLTARTLFEARPSKIYSSPKPRAKETASLIGEKLRLKSKVRKYFIEGALPGSTGFADPAKRKNALREFDRAFEFILQPAKRSEIIVIVSHENVIRHWVCKILGSVPSKRWRNISVGHASMTTIEINEDGHALITGLSEQFHLPADLRTRTM